jgi:hypothetical protein
LPDRRRVVCPDCDTTIPGPPLRLHCTKVSASARPPASGHSAPLLETQKATIFWSPLAYRLPPAMERRGIDASGPQGRHRATPDERNEAAKRPKLNP